LANSQRIKLFTQKGHVIIIQYYDIKGTQEQHNALVFKRTTKTTTESELSIKPNFRSNQLN